MRIHECSKPFQRKAKALRNHEYSWGHLCLSREAATTSERQKSLSHSPAFRDSVLAADRTSTDSNLAEQGSISKLSRHKHKVTTPNDSA